MLMQKHGVRCYLASGTDEKYVLDEAALLKVDGYFEKLYGAQDDYRNFTKRKVIQQIIAENNLHGMRSSPLETGLWRLKR